MTLYIITFVCLVIFSAFFSSVEIAYVSLNRMRLEKLADDGKKSAKSASALVERQNDVISTLLVGNNLVNTAASSIATVVTVSLLKDEAVGAVVSTAVTTVILLIFSEIIPKMIGKRMAVPYACVASYPLRVLMVIFRPVTWIVGGFVSAISVLWKKKGDEDVATVTEDEIANIIETVEEEGVIDEDQSELLQSALDFSDITVEQILTPRIDVCAVDLDDDLKDTLSMLMESKFSRFPVYRDSIDHITGVLNLSSFMKDIATVGVENVNLADHVKETAYVHKTTKLPDALEKMRESKLHMIVVLDEYGGTLGIVTMEDILEQIVGDIWDETDVIEIDILQTGERTYEVQGQTSIEDFFDEIDYRPRNFECQYTTMGGFAIEQLNEDVHVGASFEYGRLYVEVAEMAGNIVERLFILIKEDAEEEGDRV